MDNYTQQYLRHGRSLETPHYPHSVELRTLSQTGIVGGLLALMGLAAALVAAMRAMRPPPELGPAGEGEGEAGEREGEGEGPTGTDAIGGSPDDSLGRYVAAAALAGFGYWAVHGSVDWFWEFAGLGAPAFALLGLACALTPRRAALEGASEGAPRARVRRVALAVGMLALAAVVAASLVAPWLSQLEVQSAARVWPAAPAKAYARLHDAANLNPLSDEPDLLAGSIALRLGEVSRADR